MFAALRKEALIRGYAGIGNTQQLFGISVDLQYTARDLEEIFTKNIKLCEDSRLADPKHADPITRYVGEANATIVHKYTGKREKFFDFLVRHSLGRPRDIMVMGEAIMRVDPPRVLEDLRQAVFDGSRSSVMAHFQDMKPFLPVPEFYIFKFITKNVLAESDLDEICKKYVAAVKGMGIHTNGHPFCALYRLGLLGILDGDYSAPNARQIFPAPDNMPIESNENILPKATKFLIHPALDDFINEFHGGQYRMNFERKNVIGKGLDWSDSDVDKYVIQGDIVGYSDIMSSPEYHRIYPDLFDRWVARTCHDLDYHNVSKGDSLLIVDGSPTKLLLACRRLASLVKKHSEFPRDMRFGASSGPVEYRENREGGKAMPEGLPLRTAARLEPLAPPGKILATDGFVHGALEFGLGVTELREVPSSELRGSFVKDGKIHIQKKSGDPPVTTGIWEIDATKSA